MLIWPPLSASVCAAISAVGSSLVANEESSIVTLPATRDRAPSVSRAVVAPVTPVRVIEAPPPAPVRSSAPSPAIAKTCAASESFPEAATADPSVRVKPSRETSVTSGPVSVAPGLSSTSVPVRTSTVVVAPVRRSPPSSRLSAPQPFKVAALRTTVTPPVAAPLPPMISIPAKLLTSITAPRPPSGRAVRTFPAACKAVLPCNAR